MSQIEALTLVERGEHLEVLTKADYESATAFLQGATALERRIAEHYAPLIGAAYSLHRSLITASQEQRSPIRNVITRVTGLMLGFQSRETKRAEAEREKRQAKADKLAAKNGGDAPVIQAQPDIPATPGVSNRTTWRCEVVNPELVPALYMIPDQKKLDELARRMKEKFSLPGCRVVRDTNVIVKGV